MKKNDVASFFYYMWNCWDEEECSLAFENSNCEPSHFWKEWLNYCEKSDTWGATALFFASLSDENQDLLVERATSRYDRNHKIK